MASRLGSLGSLAPLGSGLRGGGGSTETGAGSLGSLAPLGGRPTSSAGSGTSGLGSLTQLSGATKPGFQPPTSSFDLDDGFDALLDAKPTANRHQEESKKKSKKKYDSDSDYDSDAGKKKDKKKKSKKKKDDFEDKSKRPLPTRKLPPSRSQATAPGDFDDDSLFGIKKSEPSSSANTSSTAGMRGRQASASKSVNHDWDDDGQDDEDRDRSRELEREREREPAPSITAAATRARGSPPQFRLEEPAPVPLLDDPKPAPATFGSRRRGATPALNPAPSPSPLPSPMLTAAAPQAVHMPTSSDDGNVPDEKPNLRELMAAKRAQRAAATEVPASAPPAPAEPAASKNIFDDDESLPLDDGSTAASPTSPAGASPSSTINEDPFGGLDDPMDEIEEKQGNLFSGFGAARPASANAPPARARRALPTAGRRAGVAEASSAQAAPAARLHTAPAASAAPAASSRTSAPAAISPPADTAGAGPAVSATLDLWFQWLDVNPRHYKDEKLVPLVRAAANTPLPKGWSLVNGWYVNSAKGTRHARHPYVKHFLGKIDSKRLALQFNVEDDDDDLDESLVASGDETAAPNTPSSVSRLNRSSIDDTHNPLSPTPPRRRVEPPAPTLQPQVPRVQPQDTFSAARTADAPSLSINTSSTPSHGQHTNVTPSPYSSTPAYEPTPSPLHAPGTTTTLQRLESVPERSGPGGTSIGSIDDLLATTREKSARLAEMERQSAERLAAAAAAASATPLSLTSVRSSGGGAAGDAARIAELEAQVRLQALTIEELEKRKRVLAFELESSDVHLAQLLGEQRARFETQSLEVERRARAELDAKRAEFARMETSYQSRLVELEERLKGGDLRRNATISEAVQAAESKARETLEQAMRLAAQNAEAQRAHFEREIESQRLLHANELTSLKQQQHDSVFLRSLVSQVESSAANIENLSKKVYSERTASERLTFEQLQVRDALLKEKEASLDKERRQNEDLLATFQKLTREHDEEKVRLREEHLRLMTLQSDIKSESGVLQEQLGVERDHLRKERAMIHQQKEAWEAKYKRESTELDLKKEMNERAQVQALESLEDAQRERADILKSLDDEREEIRLEKRNLASRRQALDASEAALRNDESEFAQHVSYFESRMADLQVLGNKVKKQSADVAEQSARLTAERALIDAAREEARHLIDAGEKAKASHAHLTDALREDRKEHEREKVKLLAQQKQLLLDKDAAMREIVGNKTMAGFHASLPTHLAHSPVSNRPFAVEELAQSFHQSPAFDAYGLHAAMPMVPPSPYGGIGYSGLPSPTGTGGPSPPAYDAHHISAALASLTTHTAHIKTFLADEKILSPTPA